MFKKMSMKVKLWVSFMVTSLLLLVVGGYSFLNFGGLSATVEDIAREEMVKIEAVGELVENTDNARLLIRQHATELNQANKDLVENSLNEAIVEVNSSIDLLRPLVSSEEYGQELIVFEEAFKQYQELIPQVLAASNEGDMVEYVSISENMASILVNAIPAIDNLEKEIIENANLAADDASKVASLSQMIIVIISIIAVLLSVLIAFFTTRSISGSVKAVVKNMETTTKSGKEIESLIEHTAQSARALDASMQKANESVDELVASIQQVAGNTNVTDAGLNEISAGVEQMSGSIRTVAENVNQLSVAGETTSSAIQEMMASIEQVAGNTNNASASIEEISAAIEEMSKSINGVSENAVHLTSSTEQAAKTIEEMIASIQQVATSAQTANQLSQTVQTDALEGTASVKETLNGMKEISKVIKEASAVMENLGVSSTKIGSIIEVIDDIAEQTNLLALNAPRLRQLEQGSTAKALPLSRKRFENWLNVLLQQRKKLPT